MQALNAQQSLVRLLLSYVVLGIAVVLLQGCTDPVSVPAEEETSLAATSSATADAKMGPGQAAGTQDETIAGIAANTPNFSILVQALTEAGLVETLNGDGQYTVFAPSNAAFAALIDELDGVDSAEELLALPALKSILLYHVAPGRRFARTVTRQKRINTLNGAFLFVDETILTDANNRTSEIVGVDIAARNGVIHEIDTVVLPPLN
ncbi:fasciclin domain-containing protein [Salinibacter sp. 10B]|uniref:fasciclin domain-containing protein n=1 Tax=Salinibacter sp. 10B TaxID=1923971 RepID=UPI000CF401E9|nr:fasciclin domain-containing protein [Salinibacter sp. 10B]